MEDPRPNLSDLEWERQACGGRIGPFYVWHEHVYGRKGQAQGLRIPRVTENDRTGARRAVFSALSIPR